MMAYLLTKLYQNNELSKDELVYVLRFLSDTHSRVLFRFADETRQRVYGKKVYLRGLTEFSNVCKQNCLYCGIRSGNKNVERYRLTAEQIVGCCERGYKMGYRSFVLQSGEDEYFNTGRLSRLMRDIKARCPEAAIVLSIGERETDEYQALFDAGADRFLMRHETASQHLYQQFHPNMTLENRKKGLYELKRIGYQVGAGFMVGLPGQTTADLVEDLLFVKELQPDMVGIGPFIPHRQTPLGAFEGGTLEQALVMLALTRLLLPTCLLPATTAMGTIHPHGREMALRAGANVLMPNLSPTEVRPKYQLYENKICIEEHAAECLSCVETRVHLAGYEVDLSRGDSWKVQQRNRGSRPSLYAGRE